MREFTSFKLNFHFHSLLFCLNSFIKLLLKVWRKKPDDHGRRNIIGAHSKRCKELPTDVLENILQRVDAVDRARLSLVCKSWQSIATQMKAAPQIPWLVRPTCKGLDFFSMSKGCTVMNLTLPGPARGGWCCGSSKGWLAILGKKHGQLFLVNPLSGDVKQLPSITTIPSFHQFPQDDLPLEARFYNFIDLFDLSSWDASECMAAAIFNLRTMIGICRPGDRTWSIYEGKSGVQYCSILFLNSNTLYAVYRGATEESFYASKTEGLSTFTLRTADCESETTLKLIPDSFGDSFYPPIEEDNNGDIFIARNDLASPYMLESTDGELLYVPARQDMFYGLYNDVNIEVGEEVDLDEVSQLIGTKINRLQVFKIDSNGGQFTRLEKLDDQVLFLSESGSVSVPAGNFAGFEGNCVYFIDFYLLGVFYLDKEKIIRPWPTLFYPDQESMKWSSIPRDDLQMQSKICWFNPNFC